MTPMSRLLRRLSLRKSKTPSKSTTVASPNSCPNLHDSCNKEQPSSSLPDSMIFKCLDYLDNPFELARLRKVNKAFRDYVDQRFANVVEMEARRVAFDRLSISSTCSSETSSCSSSSSSEPSIMLGQQTYYLHPAGYKILMRLEQNRVELLVDESWTSKEVIIFCGAMSVFRFNLRHITIDAPIIELIIASLSLIGLDRWYAFQCYLQAINDNQAHLRLSQSPSTAPISNEKTAPSSYWPKAEVLIIKTTKNSTIHLARLLDYGVRSQLVMDRRKLDDLKIVFTDMDGMDKTNRCLNRNVYNFKCWIGSAGFDTRFSQQYSINAI